jgi:hypothetical protein
VNSSLLKPSKEGEAMTGSEKRAKMRNAGVKSGYPARLKAGKGKTELGRPWGDHAHVVYKNVHMDDHIAPYGWGDWSHSCSKFGAKCSNDSKCWCRNVIYAEYNSSGPGAVPSARVKWAKQLTAAEAAAVTPAAVLQGWVPVVPAPTPAVPTPSPPAPHPTPKPEPTPSPAVCDVDSCLAYCVAKYGGKFSDQGPTYMCSKVSFACALKLVYWPMARYPG